MTLTTTPDTLAQVFHNAQTAYSFSPDPVSDLELEALYESLKWAPTAMNSQPLRVAFVRSAESRSQLAPHLAPGNVAKLNSAPVTAILAFDTDWHEHLPELMPFATDPHLAWQDRDRRIGAGRFNASLQAGYFILGGAGARSGRRSRWADSTSAGVDADVLPRRPLEIAAAGEHRPPRARVVQAPHAASGVRAGGPPALTGLTRGARPVRPGTPRRSSRRWRPSRSRRWPGPALPDPSPVLAAGPRSPC